MKNKLALLGFFFTLALGAQTQFIRKDSIPVWLNSQQMLYPWAGGMNYCQYSDIDLDQDGIMDLFVFDRSGNKITTYINGGTAGQTDYRYAPEYIPLFPKMHDWVLLRDYDCDGKTDIFTSNQSMVAVYRNVSTSSGGLMFQLVTGSIVEDREPNSTHLISALNVSWIDIPAIRDVDHDGDIDILNFGIGGMQMEYHRNMSKELYGTCDSLKFVLESLCWGEFTESQLDATITLNTPCSPPPVMKDEAGNAYSPLLHNGSCMECINTDGDSDEDLLIGDLANVFVNLMRNGGDSSNAIGDSIDDHFPGYDVPAEVNIFGCGFHLDLDNDGIKDVMFSPNNNALSENLHSSWYYRNTGANNSVHLQLITNSFLQEDMIDVGEGAIPVYFDYDNDGDDDLFVGNKAYFDPSGILPSGIALMRNDGTNSSPSFTFVTRDFAHIDSLGYGIRGMAPAFGDLDGDGDKDLIIGDVNGVLHYFRKDPGNADNFVWVQSNYQGIDIGSFAVPQLADVDRDGLNDLLIGEQVGTVNYYRNTGSTSAASFTLVTPFFGNLSVTQSGFTTGYSTPHLYDNNGSYILFVGSERGFLFRYDNIDGNLAGAFTLTDSLYVSHYEGGRIAACVNDLNNDNLFDVTIGNYAGGVSVFYGDNGVGIPAQIPATAQFSVYPNPAEGEFTIETTEAPGKTEWLTITNLSGQEILRLPLNAQRTIIPAGQLASGIYCCTLTDQNGFRSSRKLVVTHR